VPPADPASEPPDDRAWQRIVIGALVALIVVLGLVLLLVRVGGDDGDGDDVATGSSTTTSTVARSTTSTSIATSTTTTTTTTTSSTTVAPASTTAPTTSTAPMTTAPPPTIAPARCTGETGTQGPEPVAQVFYDAWTIDDRACAERVATEEAIEDLFVFDGTDAGWSSEGCTEDEQGAGIGCAFRYEGGSARFAMRETLLRGWQVEAVTFTAD
jgi:hypothetical protein